MSRFALGRLRTERGDTLVEILVTVVIMGIAITAIVGGVATSIFMTTFHRQEASEQTLLRSYADAVESNRSWAGCSSTTANYSPGSVGFTIPSSYGTGYTASATAVMFPSGSPLSAGGLSFSSPSCATDPGILQVSIQVQSSRATEKMAVVVRCLGERTGAGGPCP